MEYTDILELVALYLGYVTTVFCVSFGPFALYSLFRSLTAPGFRLD